MQNMLPANPVMACTVYPNRNTARKIALSILNAFVILGVNALDAAQLTLTHATASRLDTHPKHSGRCGELLLIR